MAFRSAADTTASAGSVELRRRVDAGQVKALYVFDPGPDGSLGDVAWIVPRARVRPLPLLIVQGVLLTRAGQAADFVLPGASWSRRTRTYTNDQGQRAGASRAIAAPGDAQDDCQILADVGLLSADAVASPSSAEIRAELPAMACNPAYAALQQIMFARPVTARTGSRRRTRPSAGSGTSCSRTCRRSSSKAATGCRRCSRRFR